MEILLFGITQDIVGAQKLTLPQEARPFTVGELKAWFNKQYPAMAALSSLAVAVDSEYAGNDLPIADNNEIALIPPVSGG